MTVSAQTPINRSTGNGVTTVFPYTFKIISSADIEVSVDGVVKTLTVDYTLSGIGDDAGGNVTMLAAPATSTSVVRRRNMALTRSTDYQDQGKLPASTLDSDLDSAVLMIQQVDEQIGRAVTVPAGVTGFNGQLPDPVSRMFLRINSAADGFDLVSEVTPGALTVTPFIETLLNDTDAAAARTTLVAQVAGSYQAAGSYAASGANNDITSLSALTSINLPANTVVTADIADAQVTPAKLAQPFTPGTAVATTSGTSVNWTSIPSWVEVITLDLFGFSLSQNVDHILIQIGTGGSPTTSGYLSSGIYISSGTTNGISSAGFLLISGAAGNATITWAGKITITRISSTEWEMSGQLGSDIGSMLLSSGRVTLAGQLDNLRLTSNGVSSFDAGKAKLSYY